MIHANEAQARLQIMTSVGNAREAGKYMVAVWSVAEDGTMTCNRTTWQFPSGKLADAVRQLGAMIDEELNPTAVPLPLAKFLNTVTQPVELAEVDDLGAVIPIDSEDGE